MEFKSKHSAEIAALRRRLRELEVAQQKEEQVYIAQKVQEGWELETSLDDEWETREVVLRRGEEVIEGFTPETC